MGQSKQETVMERDYTPDLKNMDDKVSLEDKALARIAEVCFQRMRTIPVTVDKKAAAQFIQMAEACDLIAKEFSGKLKAAVDFEYQEACITLECVYVEFKRDEFMGILQEIVKRACRVWFEPLTSGFLRVKIFMLYFKWRS